MKALVVLNHQPTKEQLEDLKKMGVKKAVLLPEELKKVWAGIDPAAEDVAPQIRPILSWLEKEILEARRAGDETVVWVQGEPAATETVAFFAASFGAKPIMATSKRESVEVKAPDGTVTKTSVFRHVRFREYPLARLVNQALENVEKAAYLDGMAPHVDLKIIFWSAVREKMQAPRETEQLHLNLSKSPSI